MPRFEDMLGSIITLAFILASPVIGALTEKELREQKEWLDNPPSLNRRRFEHFAGDAKDDMDHFKKVLDEILIPRPPESKGIEIVRGVSDHLFLIINCIHKCTTNFKGYCWGTEKFGMGCPNRYVSCQNSNQTFNEIRQYHRDLESQSSKKVATQLPSRFKNRTTWFLGGDGFGCTMRSTD